MEPKYISLVFLCVKLLLSDTSGTSLTLTGSANYAVLDQTFRFTCTLTDDSSTEGILTFSRVGQSSTCAVIVSTASSNPCTEMTTGTDYTCGCVSGQTGVYYINISSVSVTEDEATWRCQRLSTYSNNITLPVYYGPYSNVTINQNSPVTVIEDVSPSLTARCSAVCEPACSYSWRKGNQVASDNRDLSLGGFRRGQEGDYTCRAENTQTRETADSQTLTVEVQWYPAQPTHTCPDWIVLGETGSCTCQTSDRGEPAGSVEWRNPDNQQIISSPSSSVQLNLASIPRSDNGRGYICRASNSLQNRDATYTANIASAPVNVGCSDCCPVAGSAFNLTCSGPTDQNCDWFKDGSIVMQCFPEAGCFPGVPGYTGYRISDRQYVLQIDSLDKTVHDGLFKCNQATSSFNFPLVVVSVKPSDDLSGTCQDSIVECTLANHGNPAVTLQLKDGSTVLTSTSTRGRVSHAGEDGKTYTCELNETTCVTNTRKDVSCEATTPAIQTGPTAPSTGTQERNDLDCSGGRMRIHVPQTLLPTHIVTLRDPSCKVASNGSHLLADVGVNECGTTVSFTNDSVIFTNELVATALSGTTAPTIIDYGMNMKDQRVKISCIYPRENRVDFSYVPVMKEAHFYERQYGKLSFDVSQYSDEQFSHAIPHNGLPIGVTLNTELFIDISLRHASHKGVGIMVDSCIATPTSSPADPLWYTVIKDGCPAQQDVRTFASPDVDEFRFSFLVFRFTQAPLQKAGPNLPPTSMVFIHCQVSACPSQNCTNTCNPAGSHRVRREAELENSHLVSAGPFYLKSEEERGGYTGGVVAASVSMAVVATLVAIVALVAWRRSVNKLSKHQTLDEAS